MCCTVECLRNQLSFRKVLNVLRIVALLIKLGSLLTKFTQPERADARTVRALSVYPIPQSNHTEYFCILLLLSRQIVIIYLAFTNMSS